MQVFNFLSHCCTSTNLCSYLLSQVPSWSFTCFPFISFFFLFVYVLKFLRPLKIVSACNRCAWWVLRSCGQRYRISHESNHLFLPPLSLSLCCFCLVSFSLCFSAASFSQSQSSLVRFYYGEYKIFYCAICQLPVFTCSLAISFIRTRSLCESPFRLVYLHLFRMTIYAWHLRALYICIFSLLLSLINISRAPKSFLLFINPRAHFL